MLDAHLANHRHLTGDALTIADFSVAAPLFHAEAGKIPMSGYANIKRWFGAVGFEARNYCVTISASRASTPLPLGRATSGLMSTSTMDGSVSIRRPICITVCATASTSTAG